MTDPRTDPHPDSRPRDDERGSIETLDQIPTRERAVDDVEGAPDPHDGLAGITGGVAPNQDTTGQ